MFSSALEQGPVIHSHRRVIRLPPISYSFAMHEVRDFSAAAGSKSQAEVSWDLCRREVAKIWKRQGSGQMRWYRSYFGTLHMGQNKSAGFTQDSGCCPGEFAQTSSRFELSKRTTPCDRNVRKDVGSAHSFCVSEPGFERRALKPLSSQ